MVIGVLALQGDFEAHGRVLRELGADVRAVRTPQDLDGIDGLIIPGGESTTMTLGVAREGLAVPLRALARRGTPVLGTCAGLIMLDRDHLDVLDITSRRNAFGRQLQSFEAELSPGAGLGDEPLRAVFIRAPWVEEVGAGVEVLASVQAGPAAGHAVAVRQGVLLATSFHPEITGDRRFHEYFFRIVREAGSRRR